jgi:hypothetical protein
VLFGSYEEMRAVMERRDDDPDIRTALLDALRAAPARSLTTVQATTALSADSITAVLRELNRLRRDGLVKCHGLVQPDGGRRRLRWELLLEEDVETGASAT